MRTMRVAPAALAFSFIGWWMASAPPSTIVPAEPYRVPDVPEAVRAADAGDWLATSLTRTGDALPGHDEVLLQEHLGRAFVSARDGWIWQVDLPSGAAKPWLKAPMSPTGARAIPGTDDRFLLCAARLDDERYPPEVNPGVYEVTISTRSVRPLALRVPILPERSPSTVARPEGNAGVVHAPSPLADLAFASMTESNSRRIEFCNDLDVSADGERVYFSEPFPHPGAASGTGAVSEAISLARNGRLWRVDLARGAVGLVAEDYCFLDGVLLEPPVDGREPSVLITETAKFRIVRLHLGGPKAGRDEVLWAGLPGLPDGLDRDAEGRVFVALIKERSPVATWAHAHPWLKPLLLRLPRSLLPVPTATGFLVLSPDASRVLFYTQHDGSKARDLSVIVPGRDGLYLSTFDPASRGLLRTPSPLKRGRTY